MLSKDSEAFFFLFMMRDAPPAMMNKCFHPDIALHKRHLQILLKDEKNPIDKYRVFQFVSSFIGLINNEIVLAY